MQLLFRFTQRLAKSAKPKQEIAADRLAEFLGQRAKHEVSRRLPSAGVRNILVTAALPYVNNTPHLGNVIGAVLSADVYARFCRLMGHNVLYICGTDEYGTATEVKALKEKTTPQEICDKYHQIHRSIYEWFNISFDHFGRTSTPQHTEVTQTIFNQLMKNNALVEKTSTQLHCSHCDLFLADRFVKGNCKKCGANTRGDQCDTCSTIFNSPLEEIDNLACAVCGEKPNPRETTHLYLRLGDQKQALKEWLKDVMEGWSNNAKGATKGWLGLPAQDRCITRDLKWGVKVPIAGYEKKVFYVWFEAPIGYISITAAHLGEGYLAWWQPKEKVQLRQFMGKDNILFHSIISPASLIATAHPWMRPTHIAATEYLRYQGGKFSKSDNLGVFGDQCQDTPISADVWRYYLLRVRPQNFDSQFSWDDFAQKTNKELLNSIGNLTQRVIKFAFRTYGAVPPPLLAADLAEDEQIVLETFQKKFARFVELMDRMQLQQATALLIQFTDCLNQYVGKTEFWKSPRQKIQVAFLLRMLKVISLLMEPFVPNLAVKLNYLLGCPNNPHPAAFLALYDLPTFLRTAIADSSGIRDPIPLVKEITSEDVSMFRVRFGSHAK